MKITIETTTVGDHDFTRVAVDIDDRRTMYFESGHRASLIRAIKILCDRLSIRYWWIR